MPMKLEYRYYVVNSDNKIVCGFPTEQKAVEYAGKNRYRVFTKNTLVNKGIDAGDFLNWSFAIFAPTGVRELQRNETKENETKENEEHGE